MSMTTYPDHEDLVQGAAELIAGLAVAAVAASGRFTVALAGGGTPRPVYEKLATPAFANRIPWDKVHVFFGDERCVAPDDPLSNFRMAREALLDHVPLPNGNIHRINGEDDPVRAAQAYELEMRGFFSAEDPPVFDLICLGLGQDGHTASLFPGTEALAEKNRLVVAQHVEAVDAWRVTLTPGVINAAGNVVFLVEGAGKAEVLQRVLQGPHDPDLLPAQLVQPHHGRTHWLVDAAAAQGVSPG